MVELKEGYTYKIHWGSGNINNKTIHVLSILEDENQFSYKWRSSHKNCWKYGITPIFWFNMLNKQHVLTEMGKTNGS